MEINNILNKLDINAEGRYDNKFYVIDLADSNEYARMYTKLSNNAVNTEFPSFGTNTAGTTEKITNYFEIEDDNITYNIFLIADFKKKSII